MTKNQVANDNTIQLASIRVLLVSLFCLLFSFETFAAGLRCVDLFDPRLGIRDASVEIEYPLDESNVHIYTSADGTLKTLFARASQLPPEVAEYLKAQNPDGQILEAQFDSLPLKLRVLAAREAIVAGKYTFGESAGGHREIQGLIVKEKYQQKYSLIPHVDLGAPETVSDGRMIESHIRSNLKPGQLALHAAKYEKELGYKPGPMHMHVLFKLDRAWLKEKPKVNAWRFMDFWRRANLAMEMRDVFEKGVALIDNTNKVEKKRLFGKPLVTTYTNFAPLGQTELSYGLYYFNNLSTGKEVSTEKLSKAYGLKNNSKMGWIGLWGHDKYDKPNLFGFEFRFLDGSDLPKNLVEFLDKVTDIVENHEFLMDEEALQDWADMARYVNIKEGKDVPLSERFASQASLPQHLHFTHFNLLSPHRSYKEMFEELPEEMKRILYGLDAQKTEKAFNDHGRVRYLIHNWSRDPLIFKNQELQIRIENAQLKGLRRWARGENEAQVIQEFLLESGLYETMANSVGFKI